MSNKMKISSVSRTTGLLAIALSLGVVSMGASAFAAPPVTGLQFTPGTDSVSLSWNALGGSVYYYASVQRGNVALNCNAGVTGVTTQVSPAIIGGDYSAGRLQPGTTYTLSICSFNYGSLNFSAPVGGTFVTGGSLVAPPPPQALQINNNSTASLSLSWSASSGSDVGGYIVQFNDLTSMLPLGACSPGSRALQGAGVGNVTSAVLAQPTNNVDQAIVLCAYSNEGMVSEPIIIADSTQNASAASRSFVQAQIQSLVSSGQAITAAAPPPAPVTACQITVEACPNYPTVVGSFLDNYLNAGSSPVECAQRATDYQNWCDSTEPVRSEYLVNGVAQQVTNDQTSCQISLKSCPAHPSVGGNFLDNYLNAGSNAAECAQRATDYQNWCNTTDPVSSAYYANGVVQKVTNLVSSCQINVTACPNYPTVVGAFLDNYLNAGSNVAECEQRASDYESWCGTTQPVTANYFLDGALAATKTVGSSNPPTTGGGGGKHGSQQ